MRGIQYAAASRSYHQHLGILDHPLQCAIAHRAGDDSNERSRGAMRPEFCKNTLPHEKRGAGKTGCAPHPRSRRLCATRYAAYEHTGLAEASGLPCAMALRLIRFRPGDRLFCHHRRCRLSPAADLTPAPGRRTQTISPYATAALVSRSLRVHRSLPHVRDDGQRPFGWDRIRES